MRRFIIFLFLGLAVNAFSQTATISDLHVFEFQIQFGEKTSTKHLVKEVTFSDMMMEKETEHYVNGQVKAISSFKYQKDSTIIKSRYFFNGQLEYKFSYKFGADGLSKVVCYYPDGSIYTEKLYSYSNGVLDKIEMYYGNGNLYNTIVYQFIKKDNYTEKLSYNVDNELISTTLIYKDAAGCISKEITYNKLGEIIKYLEYKYAKSADVKAYFLIN